MGQAKNSTSNLYSEKNNIKQLDDFTDELVLVIKDHQDLTLFTSCSHHGILNMIDKTKQFFPNQRIQRVVGGFHMIGIPYLNNLRMTKLQVQDKRRKYFFRIYSSH